MENKEGGRGEAERATKKEKHGLPTLYVSSLQTFETSGYFDGSYKRRYPTKEKPSKVVTLGDNRKIEIVPTQKYGYPNAVDLDYQRALFRLIDEQVEKVERVNEDGTKTYHSRPPTPLLATTKKFIRYAGRSANPRERKNLNDFLHRGGATRMEGELRDPKTRTYGYFDVALFSQVITKGEKTKDGNVTEQHQIWLSPFALRLYYWHRTRQENISFHHQLTQAYAKVLYPYLDSGWFASISKGGKAYTKAYPTLCRWLSIAEYKTKSRIKQQLDPGHEDLKAQGYLADWNYKRRDNSAWIIEWFPGERWFTDLKTRRQDTTPQLVNARPITEEQKNQQAQLNREAINACIHCSQDGWITYQTAEGTSMAGRCPHNLPFIMAHASKNGWQWLGAS